MKSMLMLGIITMWSLVACGGNAATLTPSNVDIGTRSVTNPSYSIEISGDTALTMSQDDPGGYGAIQINSDGDLNLRFAANNETRLIDITFKNIDSLTSGNYVIADWTQRETLETAVFATVQDFSDPDNRLTLFSTSGNITLEVVDGLLVGNFEFNARGDYSITPINQALVRGTYAVID